MIVQGGALWAAFLVTGIFVSMAGFMTFIKRRHSEKVANLTWFEAIYTSCFCGFSVGAEITLSIAILCSDFDAGLHAIGAVMLVARVLHFFAAMILHVSLFGSKARAATVESVVPGAIALRRDLAMEFVKENIYIVGAMALLCLFDVNMFHFIPWKRSDFFRMSEGFPNMLVLKLCLAVKSVQSAISVTAELAYLFKYDTDSAYGYYTEALLVMNIFVGISAVAIEVAMFCFRGSVLAETEEKEQEAAVEQSQNAIAEMDLSNFYD